jgi:hypothetical protein
VARSPQNEKAKGKWKIKGRWHRKVKYHISKDRNGENDGFLANTSKLVAPDVAVRV